jgi:hypothetical protein
MRGERVWWVAPTYGQAFHVWRSFKRRFAKWWVTEYKAERHIDLSGGDKPVKPVSCVRGQAVYD